MFVIVGEGCRPLAQRIVLWCTASYSRELHHIDSCSVVRQQSRGVGDSHTGEIDKGIALKLFGSAGLTWSAIGATPRYCAPKLFSSVANASGPRRVAVLERWARRVFWRDPGIIAIRHRGDGLALGGIPENRQIQERRVAGRTRPAGAVKAAIERLIDGPSLYQRL